MSSIEKIEQEIFRVLNNSPIATALFDQELKLINTNDELCILLGYDKNTLLSLQALDIVSANHRQLFLNAAKLCLQKKTDFVFKSELMLINKFQENVFCKISLFLLQIDGAVQPCYVFMATNIGIAKNIFNEINKLAFAVEQSANTIVITDTEGNIQYVNKAFEKTTGYTKTEVLGKNPRILKTDYLPEEIYKNLWDTIKMGKVWIGEFYNKRKDGTTYWESAMITPIFDTNGKIMNFLAIKEDITKMKDAQEQLIKAKDEAEKSNKLKTLFLANMSHEIRTPMNAILGFADLLYESENLTTENKEMLDIIRNSGRHLLNLINDILDLSKIEAGKIKLEYSEFSVKKLLMHIYSMLNIKAKEKNLYFDLLIDHNSPDCLFGDELRVNQVLVNIIGNAIKFTNTGGITISYSYIDDTCIFKVIDTGIGIPQDRIDTIFLPFEQADISTTRKYGGTGLGLTITKKIIQLMGGSIFVESEENKGTTFIIKLPLKFVKLEKKGDIDNSIEELNIQLTYDDIVKSWLDNIERDIGGSGLARKSLYLTIPKLPGKLLRLEDAITKNIKSDIKYLADDLKNLATTFRMIEIVKVLNYLLDEVNLEKYNIEKIRKYYEQLKKILDLIPKKYFGQVKEIISETKEIDKIKEDEEQAKPKILVAEDNTTNQKLIKLLINKFGYECDIAENGKIAIEMLELQNYDLLLLDMQMPVMDGLEALKYIRNSEKLKNLYVIALTAHSLKGDAEKYLNAGCDGYVSKPIDKNILKEKIDTALINLKKIKKIEEKIDEALNIKKQQ
ncbi:MAG TPA: PAS domain S-box protein [bacterium]|nr:PAS domain S-box protein [bacterium]